MCCCCMFYLERNDEIHTHKAQKIDHKNQTVGLELLTNQNFACSTDV